MAYFLRQEKKKKGLYLQMYDSYWDKETRLPAKYYESSDVFDFYALVFSTMTCRKPCI